MMQSMKGATGILGSMNRSMNLPALQRIAMEFEKENDIMDQRQEMMDDAIDDATMEDEGAEDEVVEQVLEEIGIDLRQAVSFLFYPISPNLIDAIRMYLIMLTSKQMGETPSGIQSSGLAESKQPQALGVGGGDPGDDDLQARLDSLRR